MQSRADYFTRDSLSQKSPASFASLILFSETLPLTNSVSFSTSCTPRISAPAIWPALRFFCGSGSDARYSAFFARRRSLGLCWCTLGQVDHITACAGQLSFLTVLSKYRLYLLLVLCLELRYIIISTASTGQPLLVLAAALQNPTRTSSLYPCYQH